MKRSKKPTNRNKPSSPPRAGKAPLEKKGEAPTKETKPTMGSVMNPMMLSGKYTLDEVTEAVAKAFNIKGEEELAKLRKQIAGPRLYNLTKWAREHGEKEPRFKEVEKPEKKKAEATK